MEKAKPKRKKLRFIILILLIVLIVWTIWANKAVQLNGITVTSKNLPTNFDGYKIALVSDLHNAEFGDNNDKLIELLGQASPDIIAITGDIVDSHRANIEIAVEFARQAAQIAPCYYVSGNHEGLIEKSEYERLKSGLESAGVTILNDKETVIEKDGEKISLIGIDDLLVSNTAITKEKLEELPSFDGYTVLLSHRPDYFNEYSDAGIDLALCGHVHGGQVRLPLVGGLFAPSVGFFPEYDSGLYSQNGSDMVVSRGLGNSVIPLRFNNRPEIVLIELKTGN